MRVWILNPYGPVPGEGWRDYRVTLLARALAERGHEVLWWTASFAHQTKEQRVSHWTDREVEPRFTVRFVPTPTYSRHVGLARIWFEMMFSRRVVARGKREAGVDVIVAADPPQWCGMAGRELARHHGVPLVVDCLDLWPELFVTLAPARLRPLVRLLLTPLFRIRRQNLEAAARIVAVSDTYRRVLIGVAPSIDPANVLSIPIGVRLRATRNEAAAEDASLVCIYAGTLGERYDLGTVLETASLLHAERSRIRFIIAGRGPFEEQVREWLKRHPAANLDYRGSVEADALLDLYERCDIGLIPYAAESTVSLPVKFFDYLAAGLVIVTSLQGELRDFVQQNEVGLTYAAGDARSLAAVLQHLERVPAERRLMGQRARAATARFDTVPLYRHYAEMIEEVSGGNR